MGQYTEYEVGKALGDIANGVPIQAASRKWGVPRSTLQNRLKGIQPRDIAFADLQQLSVSQEAKLANWVQIQADLGLAPTHQQVRVFAQRILHAMGDTQPLGKRWVDAFVRRNPSIKVQRSRSIDSRRVNGASTEIIRDWFKYLAIPSILAIQPANRYNMDETGILEGQGVNGLVLGRAETNSVRKKHPGSRAWVSIIECISAEGLALYPLVIYKGKTVQQQWFPLDLDPYDGWEFTATENGWTTDETAVEWLLKVFLPQTAPSQPDQARLLTGLWPVTSTRPLLSSLLLLKATTPATPLNKAARGAQGIQDAQDIEGWASASSAVAWSTPKKIRDLNSQLDLFSKLDQSIATQRQLFRKVKKGFQEQSFQLATAQHQIQLLQAQVSNTTARKRKTVNNRP
ncbi:transposase [Colletotrichum incanum]|nr:transposase [Colletotrichum incanum]